MAFMSCSLQQIVKTVYNFRNATYSKDICSHFITRLSQEHTYFAIANSLQQRELELLCSCKEFKILYKGPGAVNRYHHDKSKQNTLIIFEKAD